MDNAIEKLAVREILDEYCLRLELDEFDSWLDLFTEDTIYEVYKMKLEGRDAMAEMLSKAPHGVHIDGPARISIYGDRAETLQSYAFVSTQGDDWNVGWYDRTLVRTDGGWKIAHTKVKFGRKEELPANERAAKLQFPIRFD